MILRTANHKSHVTPGLTRGPAALGGADGAETSGTPGQARGDGIVGGGE
jgi:hypothetical protein